MKYSILIYDTPGTVARFQKPDGAKYMSQWPPFVKALTDAGVYVTGAGLQPPDTATTLRFDSGKRMVQDGPYADTKEQLGGFYMIDVPDLDTALEWAARTPRLHGQVFEVRPNLVVPGN
ncbi:MAG: YciI family protein [Rhodanobacteraceae bacterium]|nr:MAG: YciI family protein [Rhodanobacteraceae bacterium]